METMIAEPLGTPECKYGYPHSQLEREMNVLQLKSFLKWMVGQTFSSCEGKEYDHDKKEYVPSGCGPHGYVYYTSDVNRFLAGKEVID